jgi:hypothetical protein
MQLLRGASLARLARSAARLPSAPAGSSSSSRSARGSRSCRALQHRDWRSEATGARTVARRAASGGAAAAARLPADAALCAAVSLAGWLMLRPAAILCEPAPAPGQVPERVRTLAPPPAGSAPSAVCRGLARVIDMIMQVCVGALLGRLCNGRYPGLVTALAMALPTLQMAYVWDGQSFGKRYMDVQVRAALYCTAAHPSRRASPRADDAVRVHACAISAGGAARRRAADAEMHLPARARDDRGKSAVLRELHLNAAMAGRKDDRRSNTQHARAARDRATTGFADAFAYVLMSQLRRTVMSGLSIASSVCISKPGYIQYSNCTANRIDRILFIIVTSLACPSPPLPVPYRVQPLPVERPPF